LSSPSRPTISVVLTTFERADACERALASVLAQSEQPLEILVCDHGSRDDSPERLRAWEDRSELVRYLRLEPNRGTPAAPRNLGIERARGDWIAFLDDDDEWLPEKLARQSAVLEAGLADVVGTNALRSSGGNYFPDPAPIWRPAPGEVLATNPIITSSVIVRRALLDAASGFDTSARVRNVEDYAMWLDLAERGARFVVLGEPLVRYEDSGEQRISATRVRTQAAVARLAWRHALRSRRPTAIWGAARKSAGALQLAARDRLARLNRP